jgi:hypothetical protein
MQECAHARGGNAESFLDAGSYHGVAKFFVKHLNR